MNSIEIKYRPIGFLPFTKSIKVKHPANWTELNPAQIIAIACVYKGSISDDKLISVMLSVPLSVARKMAAFHKYKILEMIDFINEPTAYHEFIIPEIRTRLKTFRSPMARLKDETFGAFIFAEHYFSRYNEASKADDLNRFVACWYRTGKFDEKRIEPISQLLASVPLDVREAIYINYQLIREWMVMTYPNVFRKEAETPKKADKNSWIDVFDAIVADDLKDQDKYASLPVSTVLRYLDKRIQKQRENES